MAAITIALKFSPAMDTAYYPLGQEEVLLSLSETTLGALLLRNTRLIWKEATTEYGLPIYQLAARTSYIAYLSIDFTTSALTLSFGPDDNTAPATISSTTTGTNTSYTSQLRIFPNCAYPYILQSLLIRPIVQSYDDIIKLL